MQPGVEAPLTKRVGQGVRGERVAGGEMEGGGFGAEIIVTPAAPSLHGSSGRCRPFSQSRIRPPPGVLSPSHSTFALPPF